MLRKCVVILFICLLLAVGGMVWAQQPAAPEVGLVEKLGETLPPDVQLYDEEGRVVLLKDIMNKPSLVTFVYYKCPGICSPLLTEVSKIVESMDLELGKDYQILTVSFDHRETPDLAAEKKDNYLSAIPRAVDANGWRFLTGDSVNIRRLTDAAGFYFKRNGNDWVHAGVLIVLSSSGKITRYMNGIQYLPSEVKLALIEASSGKAMPTIARLLKFCYSYDPESRTYALNVLRIGAILTVLLVAVFMLVFVIRPRKKNSERGMPYGQSH